MNAGSNVKFTDEKIIKLFDMFKSDKGVLSVRCRIRVTPWNVKDSMKSANMKLVKKPYNAYAVLHLGTAYDDFGTGDKPKTIDDRNEYAEKQAQKLQAAMQAVCKKSNDPLYSKLIVEIVNKEIQAEVTHQDPYDDGNDDYGAFVFFKIHY